MAPGLFYFIMKGKDPAFLFYDGDAARDVSHMNRLERGCYFDLIQAQRKFNGITVEQARKILGKDFDTCWESLELILACEDDKYRIQWVDEAIKNRKAYSEIQRKRIQDYWDKKRKDENHGITTDIPLENEDANENENKVKDKKVKYGDGVKMTKEEYDKLVAKYGLNDTLKMVEKLGNYKLSKGVNYKSDYRTILNWVAKEIKPHEKSKHKSDPQTPINEGGYGYEDALKINGPSI